MPKPSGRQSAHEQLAVLKAKAADARTEARDLQTQIEQAERDAAAAAAAIIDGHADEDQQAVAQAREAEDHAVSLGHDLVARFAGAQIRVQRAQAAVGAYLKDHAQGLLTERVEQADRIAAELSTSVHAAIRLHRQLLNEKQEMDRIISGAGHNPRLDGPAATHPWERELLALERAVKETPTLDAPAPRWSGRQAAEERDRVARELQAQRA